MPGLLEGKLGLIAGLSNKYSIAWGIAEACLREGARLAYTHQARYAEQAADLVAGQPGAVLLPLEDAADAALVDPVFERIEAELGGLDFLVHSMAYAPPTAFTNRFTDTTLEDFHVAMDSSAYSLLALTRAAEPLFRKRGGGSVTAMTYLGGRRSSWATGSWGWPRPPWTASGATWPPSWARTTSGSICSPWAPCAPCPPGASPALWA